MHSTGAAWWCVAFRVTRQGRGFPAEPRTAKNSKISGRRYKGTGFLFRAYLLGTFFFISFSLILFFFFFVKLRSK